MAKNTEEYQLEEGGEYTGEEGFEAPTREPGPAAEGGVGAARTKAPFNLPMKNKKMIIIISIFVFIFFIMQIVKLFSSGSKAKIQERPVVAETMPKTDVQLANISALNEKHLVSETKIQQLEKDMEDTKASIATIGQAVYDLNTTVQQLTAEVQKLAAEKTAARETMKNIKTPYHIRAIVNGRAWLETNNGSSTITVRLGSSLGKYGKVKEVDDKAGTVTTDKGAVIEYGRNDI